SEKRLYQRNLRQRSPFSHRDRPQRPCRPTGPGRQERALKPMGILQDVQRLYEVYPYPNYPLLAKPQWEQGYLTCSRFAQRLAGGRQSPPRHVLVAGCGEILPYILRKWESPEVQLTCVDLSRRNVARARWRTLFSTGVAY